jgi:alpha-beta hydrolase superfamily lysophospholipase
MSLITAEDAGGQGGRTIPLPRLPGDDSVLLATMVRRSPARRTRRAVLYVHCLGDPYVQPDLATWYLQRGFHFYVADLRAARPRRRDATLTEYFGYLDAAVRQVRDTDGNKTVLVSAHRAGAVIAALWCHSQRAAGSPEALIMADPDFGPEQHWLYRLLGLPQSTLRQSTLPKSTLPKSTLPKSTMRQSTLHQPAPARPGTGVEPRIPEVLPRAQRRLRRGLDIACPVLVMSPSAVNATAHGPGYRAGPPARLGPHVTSLRLASAPPGLARPDQAARRCLYDELSRWLGAYLSAEIRDQLLLPAPRFQRGRARSAPDQVTVTLTWG